MFSYLNESHDGSLHKITFIKLREYASDGSLVYPFDDPKDFILCNVAAELLLNSYRNAGKQQVVILNFHHVTQFKFAQDSTRDYSDIQRAIVEKGNGKNLRVRFFAGQERTEVLVLECQNIECQEL